MGGFTLGINGLQAMPKRHMDSLIKFYFYCIVALIR